jgi:hypothetical protein
MPRPIRPHVMRGTLCSACAVLVAGIFVAVMNVGLYRVLWAELVLLLLLELLIGSFAVIMAWVTWKDSREQRAIEAERQQFGQWSCPCCQLPFGYIETWVHPADGCLDDRGEPFPAHVAFSCPRCNMLFCFDSAGRPMSSRGVRVDEMIDFSAWESRDV